MKKISKNLVVASLGLAIITSGSVFAEGGKALSDNNSLFGANLVQEAPLRDSDLNYQNLPQGEYNIDMVIKQHGIRKQNKTSMMNKGLVDKKIIVDKNGQYYLEFAIGKIVVGDKVGYLDELYYFDNENKKVNVNVEGGEIRRVKFPINKPTEKIQRITIGIFSKGMDAGTNGAGHQLADPVLDWSNVSAME